jgi:hypothetical protein
MIDAEPGERGGNFTTWGLTNEKNFIVRLAHGPYSSHCGKGPMCTTRARIHGYLSGLALRIRGFDGGPLDPCDRAKLVECCDLLLNGSKGAHD